MEPVTYNSLTEDYTAGICVKSLDGVDQFVAHVVLLHGCPQCVSPHSDKCLLEVSQDVIVVTLVLAVFLTLNTEFEDLFCDTSSTEEHRRFVCSFFFFYFYF